MNTIAVRFVAIAVALSTMLGVSVWVPPTAPLDSPALKHLMVSAWGDSINPTGDQCWDNGQGPQRTLNTSLTLPEGSTVKYIALYYHNHGGILGAGELALHSRLHNPPSAPVVTELAQAQYEDNLVYGVVTSEELAIPIDMASTAYDLVLTFWNGGGFCAIRVDYIPPSIFAVALPSVLKTNP